MHRRRVGAALLSTAVLATALVGACADKKGALILAINTDMKAPKDVNAVSVTVSTNGAIKHSFIGRVTPEGDVLLPATLAIVQPDDANASIRIRVMAFQNQKPRVLRDVRTTVPRDGRTALLRVPLNFVNDGTTRGEPLPPNILPPIGGKSSTGGEGGGGGAADFDFFGAFQPDCPDIQNQTFIDGDCKDNAVDPGVLPDYDDTLVFGTGKDGADKSGCFDVPKCFDGATQVREAGGEGGAGANGVVLDRTTCTISGTGDAQLNLAIVTPDTGECVRNGECYVPLDSGEGGWRIDGSGSAARVQLPKLVCNLLGKGKGLRLFQANGKCAPKQESQPICRDAAPAPAMNELSCLTNCGACVVAHCPVDAVAACFGPDFKNGNVSGRCKDFYECGCKCTGDFSTCGCDPRTFGNPPGDCQACLNTNLQSCVEASCKQECNSGSAGGDGGTGSVSVNLTITPGQPAPTPPPGATFNATMGMVFSPVAGDTAVSANSGEGVGGFLKVEWCTNTLGDSKTFVAFSSGPGCAGGSPFVEFSTAQGGHWVSREGQAMGGMVVKTLHPLTVTFQGVKLYADNNGKTTGMLSIAGEGSWPNGNP